MANNWLEFWKGKNAFDEAMGVNYAYFLKKVERYVNPGASSVVLDIGSGPGNLEDAWWNRVKEIHGVDVSERYNRLVREKHRDHPSVFVHQLSGEDYLNFSMLEGKKFDIIIVMSVLQYYRDKAEVEQLIKNIQPLAAPGARLLLCDLLVKESFVTEIFQVLKDAFREGKLLSVLSLFFNLRFSDYYRIKQDKGFLVLSEQDWKEIITELNLNAAFSEEPLTLQKNRKSLIIQF